MGLGNENIPYDEPIFFKFSQKFSQGLTKLLAQGKFRNPVHFIRDACWIVDFLSAKLEGLSSSLLFRQDEIASEGERKRDTDFFFRLN